MGMGNLKEILVQQLIFTLWQHMCSIVHSIDYGMSTCIFLHTKKKLINIIMLQIGASIHLSVGRLFYPWNAMKSANTLSLSGQRFIFLLLWLEGIPEFCDQFNRMPASQKNLEIKKCSSSEWQCS